MTSAREPLFVLVDSIRGQVTAQGRLPYPNAVVLDRQRVLRLLDAVAAGEDIAAWIDESLGSGECGACVGLGRQCAAHEALSRWDSIAYGAQGEG